MSTKINNLKNQYPHSNLTSLLLQDLLLQDQSEILALVESCKLVLIKFNFLPRDRTLLLLSASS